MWLRRLVGPSGTVLVSANVPVAGVAVVTAAAVLDGLADNVAAELLTATHGAGVDTAPTSRNHGDPDQGRTGRGA
jgi:hypothetical protein